MKEFFMDRALGLSEKGSGFVNPGPLVGAVIVKNETIIGEGYCRSFEAESAEEMAVKSAAEKVINSELYMNIEPSSVETIIKSGIKKVCFGMENPDPKLKGKNLELLRNAGIEVEVGILKDRCEETNEFYSCYVKYGIPFVFVKWAMTLDGKLASRTGDSKWISGDESLNFVHKLRQRTAAIMVGENTARVDNPQLTTRLKGVEISNPLRVVLSKYGDIPDEANVLKVDDKTKTLIICSKDIPMKREDFLLQCGAEVVKLGESSGKIDFQEIIKELGNRKIDSLYIEGGSGVLASAFESGVVRKVYAAVAPKIIGGVSAPSPVGGIGIDKMRDAIVLKKVSHEIVGDDVIFKGYI